MDLYDKFDNFDIIVCGDLNARTGSQNGTTDMLTDPLCTNSECFRERKSRDSTKNVFGNQLLDFCSMFNCSIVNGLCDRGFDDGFTYISSTGSSAIDYVIMSNDLFSVELVSFFEITSRVESSHLPVSIYARANRNACEAVNRNRKRNAEYSEKVIWDCEKVPEFVSFLSQQATVEELSHALNEVEVNVDSALDRFVNCLLNAATCVKKRVRVDATLEVKRAPWFDSDCREAKSKAKHLLKAFRKTNLEEKEKDTDTSNRNEKKLAYVQARKEYRQLIKEKNSSFKQAKAQKLQASIKDSKVFWGEIRSTLGKRQSKVSDKISPEQWSQHFQTVFRTSEPRDDLPTSDTDGADAMFDELNVPITDEEVHVAISSLKNRKACGHDNVTAEMLKASGNIAVTFFTQLFNKIFSEGVYPEQWSRSVIVPLFKKGDRDIPNNYRGISLQSVASVTQLFCEID